MMPPVAHSVAQVHRETGISELTLYALGVIVICRAVGQAAFVNEVARAFSARPSSNGPTRAYVSRSGQEPSTSSSANAERPIRWQSGRSPSSGYASSFAAGRIASLTTRPSTSWLSKPRARLYSLNSQNKYNPFVSRRQGVC